jgi:site-specific recombinase XerD
MQYGMQEFWFLINNNIPIRTIQKLHGHEKGSITEIYLHISGKSKKLAM